MNPDPSISVGCRIIAEFTDDASEFAKAEPEYVPVPRVPVSPTPAQFANGSQRPFTPPTQEEATAARAFWLKVIRRYTEPVAGKKGRLWVSGAEPPGNGEMHVVCRSTVEEIVENGHPRRAPTTFIGSELDATDKSFLTLFASHRTGADCIEDRTFPILWTEIASIDFRARHPASPEAQG